MKKLGLTLLLVGLPILTASAQIVDGLSVGFEGNGQWYNDDKKTGPFTDDIWGPDDQIRSNTYLKIDYNFLDNWFVGMQAESYLPHALVNYSPDLDGVGLGLYYGGYRSEKLEVTAGYFYEQFGSGLALRSWENRQLGLNNALRGGRVKYTPTDNFELTALYARQREGFDVSEGDIYGLNSRYDISKLFKWETSSLAFGASYVGRDQKSPFEDSNFDDLTNVFSGRADFIHKNFHTNIEYVNKSEDGVLFGQGISNDLISAGNAFLINAGYSQRGLGIETTVRRMQNMSFYSEREANSIENEYNQDVMNYLPALTKQHDYALTNIYVYQAQPGFIFLGPNHIEYGEIGGQIDVYYTIKKGSALGGKYGTKLAFNASYWANLRGEFDLQSYNISTDLLGFGEKYFSDINIEIRKKWSKSWSTIATYVNQYYNKKYIEDRAGQIKTDIATLEGTYKMGKGRSLRLEGQHLWTKEDKKNWAAATVEYNFNSTYGIYVTDSYNYGNDNEDNRIHYYNVGGRFTKGATRIALNYGRQRGGLVCVGGVCRFVPETTGLTLNVSTAF
ncbi:DUF6029 family protein [Mangrovimonas aestuarii]|uniref:DUF6029 family protein n=1 Tax=Mangrovimonas aestuarii TaxID=3018443 RepID=UPI0023787D72|nr:DUF6029 family protein [Mangrovimonas aestuarii]